MVLFVCFFVVTTHHVYHRRWKMEEKFRTKYMKFKGETEAWWIDGISEDINKFLNQNEIN